MMIDGGITKEDTEIACEFIFFINDTFYQFKITYRNKSLISADERGGFLGCHRALHCAVRPCRA